MGYIIAPEFHKQMWLNVSPFKLAAAPLFALVFSALLYETKASGLRTGEFAALIFLAIVFLLGCKAAGNAVQEELSGCTWDIPRFSRQSVAQLCFGMFLGAVAYPWYCALLIFLLGAVALGLQIPYSAIYVVTAALLGQSAAFLVSLVLLPPNKPRWANMANSNSFFSTGMGIMVGAIAYSEMPLLIDWNTGQETFREHISHWYDYAFDGYTFTMASLCFFIFWAFCGCYRVVKRELMHRVMPVAWTLFLATLMVWVAGFTKDIAVAVENIYVERAPVTGLTMAYFVALLMCFFTMQVEAGNRARYSRLWHYLREREWRRALENTPMWVATVPFVLGMFALTAFHMMSFYGWLFEPVVCLMLTSLLFFLRDGFVVHAIHRAKKTISSLPLLLYFVFVYGLFPFLYFAAFQRAGALPREIFRTLGLLIEQKMLFEQRFFIPPDATKQLAMMLFYPVQGPNIAIWFAAVQAVIAGLVFIRILRATAHKKAATA